MLKKKNFWLLLVFTSSSVLAQNRPQTPAPTPGTTVTTPPSGTPPGFGARTNGPKPYKEVITDKAVTKKGLFTVHKIEDKYYFEIPNDLFGREIIAITRASKVPFGANNYAGEMANDQVLKFEKGPSNNVFLRVITLQNTADSAEKIYKSVIYSNVQPIAAAFQIAAWGKDSNGVVLDVTDFFKGDNAIVGLQTNARNPTYISKRKIGATILAQDRTYIVSMNTYPINTEIRTVKTYLSSPSSGGPSPFGGGGGSLPAGDAAGAITLELNTSMLLLPEKPMQARAWDKRVGFFWDNFIKYSDNQQKIEEHNFITRWRLEPKDEDVEKWKRGELVVPKKPIIYYIDPATPKQWRKHLIAGVNDWQKSFEKAGFMNAIMAKEWPEDDSTMSLEDARYSVIRYFASDIENAYGPNVHDPRSGEILESHIGWYHNVMKLVHDWYMIQTAAVDPGARKMKFDDELMGDLIRFVSSHEVGHTLGLMHNMGSSSKTPVEKLRDKTWVEANGHTASIMDYARFNYVAQPEDNISRKGLYPRIGDYDNWAIKWGYGYIAGNTEDERKKNSNKLIVDALKANPRHWFGTYEFGNGVDARTQSEDLSDNAIKASEYGIKNLKRIVPNLMEWTKEEAEDYSNLSEIYNQVFGQFNRYLGHVSRNIGGIYETYKSVDMDGDAFEVTPKNIQKEAFNFLAKNILETPTWLLDKNILNKIKNPTSNENVQNVQTNTLNSLLDASRLYRMITSASRFGAANTYNFDELMEDAKKAVWSELASRKAVDVYRRNLQKAHIERLIALTDPQTPQISGLPPGFTINFTNTKNTDVTSYAKGQLKSLQAEINAAIAGTTDKLTRYHLQDCADRIKLAFEKK